MAKSLLEQLPEIVANGEASSEQMLEALSTVAKMLETKASGNQEITSLAKQVQELVAAKVTK
jgi:hypothetical protein